MCKWGTSVSVLVRVPADLSSTGEEKWRDMGIDACIAPLVDALQKAGIDMRASCCGHGHLPGSIILADGRELLIMPNEAAAQRVIEGYGTDIHGAIRSRDTAVSSFESVPESHA